MVPFKILLKNKDCERPCGPFRFVQNKIALWYYHNMATRWAGMFLHEMKWLQKGEK